MRTLRQTVRLHEAQHAFCHSKALYRGFVGGRGSGKSWAGAYDLLMRVLPERTYLVGSPTSILMKDTTYPTFTALAKQLGLWRKVKLTPYPNVTLARGTEVRFRTAEDPEKMRGPNLSGVWLDEGSLMHEDAYKINIGSLREAGQQGWLSSTFTPKGFSHWTYERFGQEQPNTALFHSHTKDNPFLPADFAETLAGQYEGQFARQELGGEFVSLDGAEWPAEYFDDGIWFDDWPKTLTQRILSLDPSKGRKDKKGDYSAYVLLGCDPAGNLWCDAHLDNRRDTSRIVEDGLALARDWGPTAFVLEINGFQELIGGELFRVSRQRGLHLPLYGIANYITSKAVRIRSLGPILAQRKIRFKRGSPGAQLLVQQLRDFPEGKHDDGPDALEMGCRMLLWLLGGRKKNADNPQPFMG